MELQFEKDLPHQRAAIDSILKVTETLQMEKSLNYAANRELYPNDEKIKSALSSLQKNFSADMKNFVSATEPFGIAKNPCLYIDVKMETGTGKTYVYTGTIHELHRQLGVSKFIVVVPGKSIKAGASSFLSDPDVKKHFENTCNYKSEIRLLEGTEQKSKNKKKNFPSAVSNYYQNPGDSDKYISVLLLNSQLLTNSNYTKDDFDYGIDNFYCPLDALKATRPVVIIDEPHRFASENKAMAAIMNKLCPQILIRFGATYPEKIEGRGKKKTARDYKNLVYNLDAYESFHQNLIKGIAKEHIPPLKDAENIKIKVVGIDSKNEEVKFSWTDAFGKKHQKTLASSIPLSNIHENFGNLSVEDFDKGMVRLSNGVSMKEGDSLTPDMYATAYQEAMLTMAIRRHLETEWENFKREDKIKTLALFFIDDISAYRNDLEAKSEYLRISFEKILKREIKKVTESLQEDDAYRVYLEKSLEDISKTHGGYFAKDNASTDEAVAQEVTEILHDKKSLLSMDNPRRFIFSKWTLKEGWDNPNVFTIAKLRSSGSEISKLQEVGRGLRLPVNEYGKRVTGENFVLNYIVDYTEKEFAQKLVDEINGERVGLLYIAESDIQKYADQHDIEFDDLVMALVTSKYIKMRKGDMPGYPIVPENAEAFEAEYPELYRRGDAERRIIDRNKKPKGERIGIRSEKYAELKKLWLKMNEHYLLTFDESLNEELEKALPGLIDQSLFQKTISKSVRDVVSLENGIALLQDADGGNYEVERPLAYGKFLQRVQSKESIPVTLMHKTLCDFANKGGKVMFNERTLSNICKKIHDWKINALSGRFSYQKVSRARIKKTSLNDEKGNAEKFISQGLVGKFGAASKVPDKYLYDSIAYDSPIEKSDILNNIEGVEVYGKIPKSTIRIPTILGETYSPDFMYIIRRKGKNELNLIVECKDVNNPELDLRGVEKLKIEFAKVFFKNMESEGIKVHFEKQLKDKNLEEIIGAL